MKEHITPQDLNSLTNAQKETLRSIWLPEKNDLAAASLCTNVETEEYDDVEFVIGEIQISDKMLHHRMVLRRLRLMDEPEIDGEDEDMIDIPVGDEADSIDDEYEIPYCEPEQYFNFEDCLPLLSIGQMIGMLRKSRVGQNGFQLFIPPDTNKIFERRLFTIEDNEGEAFENEELCDLLWEAVKTIL